MKKLGAQFPGLIVEKDEAFKKVPILMIHWRDAASASDSWTEINSDDLMGLVNVYSVGWAFRADEDSVALASHGSTWLRFSGDISIPYTNIVRVWECAGGKMRPISKGGWEKLFNGIKELKGSQVPEEST